MNTITKGALLATVLTLFAALSAVDAGGGYLLTVLGCIVLVWAVEALK